MAQGGVIIIIITVIIIIIIIIVIIIITTVQACFKCSLCNKLLDSTLCCEHEGKLYCKVTISTNYGQIIDN